MAATKLALRVVFAALLVAGGASAKVYVEWRPRMSFMAGYNDNVLLNGTGADGVGQAVPGIKLDIFGDHALHVALDCQAGLARICRRATSWTSGRARPTRRTRSPSRASACCSGRGRTTSSSPASAARSSTR